METSLGMSGEQSASCEINWH